MDNAAGAGDPVGKQGYKSTALDKLVLAMHAVVSLAQVLGLKVVLVQGLSATGQSNSRKVPVI
ncbi:hypothetical protein RSA46_14255 [Pseudomonas oryzihabitans]|nr:hypothetical protein NS201_18710 [Pseudomonas psychrotolerans]KTT40770.1 hypothetical protein SB5_06065 [Pseudomonas psychrotolerans]KTT43949.1 hypothetical protein RSA46_14255 [Pseudomonas psychrotolerans]